MGVIFIYQDADVTRSIWSAVPYFSISVSLNVLLTLMIIIRLIMQTRDTRNALGITGIGGLCKAIIIMLVESCALFAVSSLLVIGPLGAGNSTSNLFMAILGQTQVCTSPQLRPSDGLTNVTTEWAGHRFIAGYSPNC